MRLRGRELHDLVTYVACQRFWKLAWLAECRKCDAIHLHGELAARIRKRPHPALHRVAAPEAEEDLLRMGGQLCRIGDRVHKLAIDVPAQPVLLPDEGVIVEGLVGASRYIHQFL